jgi:hypothetical protein
MSAGENQDFIRVVKEAPRRSTMPPTAVAEPSLPAARRTAYSANPRICKHQFGAGEAFCRYCVTTNPDIRMSFHDLG